MTAKGITVQVEDNPEGPTEHELLAAGQINQWEFQGTAPTREKVLELLAGHRDVWGIDYSQYADYVQALPQNKKITRRLANGARDEIYFENWTLYISVAGRLAMLQEMQEKHGWVVRFTPEPVTPTGVPGFISLGDTGENGRIIYREYLEVLNKDDDEIGRRPGTAWVPYEGGQQAAGTNPYEKVETSARGRAIAAWGIGILPGSGIASVEEMQGMWQQKEAAGYNAAGMAVRPDYRGRDAKPRKTREELIHEANEAIVAAAAHLGVDRNGMMERVVTFGKKSLGLAAPTMEISPGVHGVNWDAYKDGQIVLLTQTLDAALKTPVEAQPDTAPEG